MPDDDLRAEVLAANHEVVTAGVSARPIKNLVTAPARPEPSWVDDKNIERAFNLEQFGEAELIKRFFSGLYVRDNLASSPSEKSVFTDIFKWTGACWELDTDHGFKADLIIVGQAFQLRAWGFYDQAAEKYLPKLSPPTPAPPDAGADQPAPDPPASGTPASVGPAPRTYDLAGLKAMAKDKELATPELVGLVKKGDEYLARSRKCWTLPRLTHAAALACAGPGSLGFSGQWNALRKMLPCRNGTLDLTTGEFSKPRPEHYFNKVVPWDYLGPDIPAPTWTDLLAKCLGHDKELLGFFEMVLASCLIGLAPKNFFVAYGPSANNGKSLLFGFLARLLGEFAVELGPDLFLSRQKSNSDAPRPGILRLEGARAAILSEADARDWWDLGQTKKLTGGDKVNERSLNQATYRKFFLEATFILHTNHLPRTGGLDRGFQDRLVVIPFLSRFLAPDKLAEAQAAGERNVFPAEPRMELDRRLDGEMSGVLGRLAKAAGNLLLSGGFLPPQPPICLQYGEDYLYDQDMPGQFILARCALGPEREAFARDLYMAFKEWCVEARGMEARKVPSETAFGRALHARFRDRKRDHKRGWRYTGLSLKSDSEERHEEEEMNEALF